MAKIKGICKNIDGCDLAADKVEQEVDSFDFKCKECGKCAQACPYHAIAALKRPCKFACPVDAITYDENGISVIDEEKCINCKKSTNPNVRFIRACPNGHMDEVNWPQEVHLNGSKDCNHNKFF